MTIPHGSRAQTMDKLIEGYRRFRAGTWPAERSRFEELSRIGQRPRALVIACSDSRTDPQMIFNARPGELFVVRNIANLVPPYAPDRQPQGVSSAIEFAVRVLRVPAIVVVGHAMCGGIQALLHGAPSDASDFLAEWVRIAEPARRRAMLAPEDQRQGAGEHEAVRLSLENLMTFPWIKDAVSAGNLTLHGCLFDIRSGILERLGQDNIFHPILDEERDQISRAMPRAD
jgi:carbonic anhydrase